MHSLSCKFWKLRSSESLSFSVCGHISVRFTSVHACATRTACMLRTAAAGAAVWNLHQHLPLRANRVLTSLNMFAFSSFQQNLIRCGFRCSFFFADLPPDRWGGSCPHIGILGVNKAKLEGEVVRSLCKYVTGVATSDIIPIINTHND